MTPSDLRRHLHAHPEPSGSEAYTARAIAQWLTRHAPPSALHTHLGGHGLLALYPGRRPGRVLLRADIDALPIAEATHAPHASTAPGLMHACGHDGHAATLAALALRLRHDDRRPTALLLFQPAEETGSGARAVVADPAWHALSDGVTHAFALHNDPGRPLGSVRLRPGPMFCASTGLRITLRGRTAHAAHPENADSPAQALADLLTALPMAPDPALGHFAMTTLTHASLGAPTFGVTPGHAALHVTCRAERDDALAAQTARVAALVRRLAAPFGPDITPVEPFAATLNDPAAVDIVLAARPGALVPPEPVRWSEDFGVIAADLRARGAVAAMLMLGAGESVPPLHDPAYDFPDALIDPGAGLFWDILQAITAASG